MKQVSWVPIFFSLLVLTSCTQNSPLSRAIGVSINTGGVSDSAPAPKTADGRPDFSGIWQGEGFGSDDNTLKYFLNIAADFKPEEVPFQPWAAALYEKRVAAFGKDEPDTRCLPRGVPKIDAVSPFKFVQVPGLTVILYEDFGLYRQVFTDGRNHPKDYLPSWMGHSIANWDGDVFVVDTVGFNDKTWLDARGHPHTDALH